MTRYQVIPVDDGYWTMVSTRSWWPVFLHMTPGTWSQHIHVMMKNVCIFVWYLAGCDQMPGVTQSQMFDDHDVVTRCQVLNSGHCHWLPRHHLDLSSPRQIGSVTNIKPVTCRKCVPTSTVMCFGLQKLSVRLWWWRWWWQHTAVVGVPSSMMFDAYLVDLFAFKEVVMDWQTDWQTSAFLEQPSQLKMFLFLHQ